MMARACLFRALLQSHCAYITCRPPLPSSSDVPDDHIRAILRDVSLGYLLDRFALTDCAPWEDLLSGGEVQRVGFARALFHQPQSAAHPVLHSLLLPP